MEIFRQKIIVLFAACSLFAASASSAHAAILTLGSSQSVRVGDAFTVPIYVSAEHGESLNTVQTTVNFPPGTVRIISLRDPGLISMWPEKTAYSNAAGTLSLLGIIYNPGFSGSNGAVLLVTFKALQAGDAQLTFADPSVLANDGAGTEILSSSRGTTIHVAPAEAAPASPANQTLSIPTGHITTISVTPTGSSKTSVSTTSSTVALDITAMPITQTGGLPPNTAFTVSYDFLDVLVMVLAAICIVFSFIFLVWYVWHRTRDVRYGVLRFMSPEGVRLHSELLEIRDALTDESSRIMRENKVRELTPIEKHALQRLTKLVKRANEAIAIEAPVEIADAVEPPKPKRRRSVKQATNVQPSVIDR